MTSTFFIEPLIFPGDLHPIAARVELGLTCYLSDPQFWCERGARRAFEVFLDLAPTDGLAWYTTSLLSDWRRVSDGSVDELVDGLSARAVEGIGCRPRHGFRFEVADQPGAPGIGFLYQEVDPRRTERVPVLELTLPLQTDPNVLLRLARDVAHIGPFWAGIGGYVARYSWREPRVVFNHLYKWCGRFLGVDVQLADSMAWQVRDGLPGVNWLTMVGLPFADRHAIGIFELAKHSFIHATSAVATPHGIVIQAGEEPDEGDTNTLQFPHQYAEVASLLAKYFVSEPREFPGLFGGRYETRIWMRRLIDVEEWNSRRG